MGGCRVCSDTDRRCDCAWVYSIYFLLMVSAMLDFNNSIMPLVHLCRVIVARGSRPARGVAICHPTSEAEGPKDGEEPLNSPLVGSQEENNARECEELKGECQLKSADSEIRTAAYVYTRLFFKCLILPRPKDDLDHSVPRRQTKGSFFQKIER
ncbi:hypothetical protein K458DRAFT_10781 [Lentithecium fluviatile CBS 122367]|uniref:Uncharacterized protein n=1 Tax=Lentithecium fluviatile CBS 122367 TaxID=1168545 RepID=A0A6G1JPT5_9PLEO|nr:hypothetical protein K458DRAFT_10781 [Lentithecium fluviatile CBS 122367]